MAKRASKQPTAIETVIQSLPPQEANYFDRIGWINENELMQLDRAQAALDAGIDVTLIGPVWLNMAIGHKNDKLVELLVKNGIDPGAVNHQGETPLMLAAQEGNGKVVKVLLENGADANFGVGEENVRSALSRAAENGKADIVEALLAAGAKVDHEAMWQTVGGKGAARLKIVNALLDAGADPNGGRHITVLMHAASDASPEVVQRLIEAGADVNACTMHGTAAHRAIEENRADNLQVLIDAGIDLSVPIPGEPSEDYPWQGMAALAYAKHERKSKCLKLLKEIGDDGATPGAKKQKPKSGGPSVAEAWKRLEAALKSRVPEIRKSLKKPATEKQLATIEKKLGVTLPAEVRESYLTHNGQTDDADEIVPAKDEWGEGYRLLPLAEVTPEWEQWKELLDSGEFEGQESDPPQEVRNDWWNAGWIPIASDGGGNSICVDLNPTKKGTLGQLISMSHETGDREVLAKSMAVWLADLAQQWESAEPESDA